MGRACCKDGRWNKDTQDTSRKTRGDAPHGRSEIRWEDNIIRDLMEIDYEGNWRTLSDDRVTWHAYILLAMNLRIP